MTTQQANIRSVDGELEIGVGTIFHRNYRWELLKSQAYLVDYGDPKMVIHSGPSISPSRTRSRSSI